VLGKFGMSGHNIPERGAQGYRIFNERGDAKPSAEVLNRIAQALDSSPDYLIHGTLQDKAESTFSDNEQLIMYKKVGKLPEDKKRLVKSSWILSCLKITCIGSWRGELCHKEYQSRFCRYVSSVQKLPQ